MLVAGVVGKQVTVSTGLLNGSGVKVGHASPFLAVTVVTVNDAGEVLVLVVAGSGELVKQESNRDEADSDEETGLSHPSVSGPSPAVP